VALCGAALLAAAVMEASSCGGTSARAGFGSSNDAGDGGSGLKRGGDDGAVGHETGTSDDSGGPPLTPSKDAGHDAAAPESVAFVYAESPDTLYQLDPTTNAIKAVGRFSGACAAQVDCADVIDIALDKASNGYASTGTSLYSFDVKTAVTKLIASKGNYPNSLSFVPQGTLDPNAEALVGYQGSTYVRIDTTTGVITNVGGLTGGYSSSGDIVSVIDGGTFLTVNGNGCGDCLLQVDPKTGDLIQNYGSVNHADVYGLAFWAGAAYGFDSAGQVFSITFPAGKLVTQNIPVPGAPKGLVFYGAGSTTSAPPTAPDGGGIPIK
jgi:hypothetical protein